MTRRDRIVVLVLIGVAALAAFWFLVLGPKRDDAAELGKQVAAAEQRRDAAQASVDASMAARAQYAADYATVARLGKAVPVDDDVPGLVYQLQSTASATDVDFRAVKLDAGSAGGSAAAAAAATPPAANSQNGQNGQKSGQPGGQSGQQPVAAPAPGAPATQSATATLPPGATVGPAGFPTMPFTFTFDGSFFRLADFFQRLERYIRPRDGSVAVKGRLLMVNGISLKAAPQGFPRMRAQVSSMAYLLPADQGLTDGATPAAPSGGTQPVSTGTTSAPPTTSATGTAP